MINPIMKVIVSCLCCCASFALAAQSETSREPVGTGASGLEEVIVTARKRQESLQEVPVSITTVSGEDLRKDGIQRLENFASSVPNFHYSLTPSSNDSLFIRGIGSGVNYGFESTVGLVVDGFFYSRTKIGRAAFLDLERIEVLKGPQGAILGKNNSAGALLLTSAKPTDEFEGMVSVTGNFEGDEGYSVEGFVSGPLADTLKGRLAFRHDAYDGFIKNEFFDDNEQDTDDWTGRATLEWSPDDSFNAMVSYQRVDFTRRGQGRELLFCGPGKLAEATARPGVPAEDCELNYSKSTIGEVDGEITRDRFTQRFNMTHLTMNWNVLGHTLTSLTGLMNYKTLDSFDGDNTPTETSYVYNPEDYGQVMQELRLTASHERFDYTLGTFLLFSDQDAAFNFVLPTGGLNLAVEGSQEGETYAVFGDLTFRLVDDVDITFGARYTYEKKELEQTHNLRIPWTSIGLGELYNINPSRSENDFSPSVDLRWRPYEDVNLYASVRRGYRGGGFDRFLFSFSQAEAEANVEFSSENVIAYEIGAKLELLDNTLRLNAALFRSEYDDLQVSTFISATQFRVFNAASATSQGLELSMHWQPNERFSMSADLGLLDAEYDDFPNAACYTGQTAAEGCTPLGQDLSGKTLEHAPDVQATVAGTYIWPIGGNLQLSLHGQLSHSAASYQGIDLHPAKKQESYQLLSGRLGLSNVDETWEVAVIGRNLTDELVFGYTSNSSPDGIDGFLLEPRVVGVQVTYRF